MAEISVIIPSYNDGECLSDAVRSAHDQEGVCEIIVVDDASTDETPQVLADIKGAFPKLRSIRHETNRGVSAARNSGIRAALGDHIAFLDADDVWMEGKTAAQIKLLQAAPGAFCMAYYYLSFPEGNTGIKSEFLNVESDDYRIYSPKKIELGILTRKLWFGTGSTLMASIDAIKKNGFFNENLVYSEEWEYITRHLAHGGQIEVVPQFLMEYKVPAANKSYNRDREFSPYMIGEYRCAVAERWGEEVAHLFVKALIEDEHSRRAMFMLQEVKENHEGKRGRVMMKEISDMIAEFQHAQDTLTLPIPPHAPCLAGFECKLKNGLCVARPA